MRKLNGSLLASHAFRLRLPRNIYKAVCDTDYKLTFVTAYELKVVEVAEAQTF